MTRSNYTETKDNLAAGRLAGAVKSAINGKRGQAFLKELIQALDEMEDKRLYTGNFETEDGEYCALGAVGAKRGLKMDDLGGDKECDHDEVARRFGLALALTSEVMYLNDGGLIGEYILVDIDPKIPRMGCKYVHNGKAPEQRWAAMRRWAVENLKPEGTT